jgi:NAD(P)-dependent dehydrogenase (short-subunit alcohol dehydrogenase family)
MGRLEGKVALITGAGNGIGAEAARLFAREGARIVVAELKAEDGRAVESQIRSAGGQAVFIQTDVTDEASVQAAIQAATATYGKLDVLYNNAGASSAADGPVTEAPAEEFWRAIRLNLFGAWLCCRYGIPEIAKAGGGSVINTASVVALMGLHRLDAYTASKGGLVALTRSMAVEFAPMKVRVNALAPTTTMTPRVMELRKNRQPGNDGRNLLGPADPIDVAFAALYLASDESRRVTGHILPVDSGLTAT